MKHYIAYSTSMFDLMDFLDKQLFSYKRFVNIEECARSLVYDFFSARFSSPYKFYPFNNCLVFLTEGSDKVLGAKDLEFVARTMMRGFWPMLSSLNYICSHCGNAQYAQRPTDCYFNAMDKDNVMVYVPVDPNGTRMPAVEIPEIALLHFTKGGTA